MKGRISLNFDRFDGPPKIDLLFRLFWGYHFGIFEASSQGLAQIIK
jgi:hypothetical protein